MGTGALLFLAAFPIALQAGPLGVADGYNVFVFTTLQSTSDIGGRAAAGTYFKGTVTVGNDLTSSSSNYDVVAGTGIYSGGKIMVNSKGKAFVPNGTQGSSVLMNGGGSLVKTGTSPIDFSAAKTQYQNLSTSLSRLTTTGSYSSGKIAATSTGINVFDLTASQYATLTSISTDGGTVIVNVAGTPGTSQSMFVDGQQNTGDSSVASKVLFNFYQDTSTLTLGNAFGGSVLAPWATISGSSQYNGTIVANALNFSGEIHPGGEFTGQLPTTTTPEPGGMALAGLGLLGASVIARRKKT